MIPRHETKGMRDFRIAILSSNLLPALNPGMPQGVFGL